MASLLTIPLELLVAISSFLPTEDLGALRLACKQMEKSLYEWFSKEFFSKKQFMLTHKSLQALIDISKHASFSKKLTHVIISTNLYEDIPLRFRDEESAARYIQGYEDQQALFDTGVDREMLTEAFSRLENLQTVGIRNFDANNRFRDGKSWSSWGATTVYHETGYQLNSFGRGSYSSGQNERFFSRVFSTIIYALGRANRHPPEIEVLLRKYGLFDSAFSIPDFFRPTVEPVLRDLTTLLLNVGLIQGSMHTHSNGTIADPHPGRSLRSFLGHTPNLKHLRLNFDKHRVSHNEAFLHWLSEPVSTAPANATFLNPPPIALAQLQTLEFGQLSVQANLIAMLVSKFAPTLQDLSLWRMDLRSITPRPYSHKPNYWKDLFEMLSNIPQLNLNHVKVGMLQQEHMFVSFKEKEDGEPWKQKEHTGKGMGKFLEGLVEQVFVQWPPEIPVSNSDGEDEDEDEDSHDEGLDIDSSGDLGDD